MSSAAQPSALRRLGRTCYRHHWRVLGIWIAALVVLGGIGSAIGTGYSDSFGDFDSEATRGFDLLEEGFGGGSGETQGSIVFTAEQGVDDPKVQAAMTELFEQVAALEPDGEIAVVSPYDNPQQVVFQGDLAGRLAYAQVNLPGELGFSEAQEYAEDIRELFPSVDGLEVLLGGQIFAEFEPPQSEVLGLGFAIVVLILAFGSVLAMGLPIGVAMSGIGAGVVIIGMVSNLLSMPDFTATAAVMIGLGVGIDYALFIVTRFREDLHRGMAPEDAAGSAIDTAGRAVIFAGITVVISVLGMLTMGLGFIQGIASGIAIAVVGTLLASITLLPALLGIAKERLEVTRRRGIIAAGLVALGLVGIGLGFDAAGLLVVAAALVVLAGTFVAALKVPLRPRPPKQARETFWYRYSRFVQRHPWTGALGGLAILAVLAIPVFGLRLGFSDAGNFPTDTETRRAYDLLAEGFGPGFNGPLLVVAEVPEGTDDDDLESVSEALADNDGVAFVAPVVLSPDGSVAQWLAVPTSAPQDEATEELVRELRGPVLGDAAAEAGVEVLVTSFTAMSIDFSDYLESRYPLFFGIVLGLSFLLLMAVFRSVLVPLKAVIVNLLSIGAAYGVVVAVFQWGWGGSLLDIGGAPVEPFIPMMLFSIVFGLSMDYEVFLLSRMKEEYDRTGDNSDAVADGLAVTARVITAAALIMVVVFGSFLLEPDRVIKLMGTGLAVAVLLDASVIRMLVVPATMELLGDRNWWLPKWLDRILPVIHVEGAAFEPGDDEGEGDTPIERELVDA